MVSIILGFWLLFLCLTLSIMSSLAYAKGILILSCLSLAFINSFISIDYYILDFYICFTFRQSPDYVGRRKESYTIVLIII
jgi:hypothetical protein